MINATVTRSFDTPSFDTQPFEAGLQRQWLRLARCSGIGPRTLKRLSHRLGGPDRILAFLESQQKPGRRVTLPAWDQIDQEIHHIHAIGARLVTWADAVYPASLRATDDPPPALTVLGDIGLLARPALAIVGTRQASAHGKQFSETLARDLGQAGFIVTSGLARGIDAAAHRGALPTGTIAVLGTGIDQPYPQENIKIYQTIAERGVVVSEMPFGTAPMAKNFPRRNRIISGFSLGVIVIEAMAGSGAMITARFALEQGRDVFAVPGFPADPRSAGPNRLLKDGAKLVEHVSDILDVIGPASAAPSLSDPVHVKTLLAPPKLSFSPQPEFADLNPSDVYLTVTSLLGTVPVAVDELLRQCQCSAPLLRGALLELELAGRLERHPGDRVSLRMTV